MKNYTYGKQGHTKYVTSLKPGSRVTWRNCSTSTKNLMLETREGSYQAKLTKCSWMLRSCIDISIVNEN